MERKHIGIIGHVGHGITIETLKAAVLETNMNIQIITSENSVGSLRKELLKKKYKPFVLQEMPRLIDQSVPIKSFNQKSKKQKKNPYQSMSLRHKFHK